jgi:hypothetical protein
MYVTCSVAHEIIFMEIRRELRIVDSHEKVFCMLGSMIVLLGFILELSIHVVALALTFVT